MATEILDVLRTKRDGGRLSDEQIRFFIDGYTAGTIADEQAAALLMAIVWRGMEPDELATWTAAMIDTGERADLHTLFSLLAARCGCALLFAGPPALPADSEAAAAAEVVEHRGIRRGCIHRQGREEGVSRGHRCVGSVEVIAVQDALLDAHAEGLEQADAGAGFVALEGLVEAGHVRAFRLDHPCQEAGLKQTIFEGGLTVFAKANGLRGGLVLLRKTVIDQADGGSAGHRLIRPRAGFEDGRDVPRHVR